MEAPKNPVITTTTTAVLILPIPFPAALFLWFWASVSCLAVAGQMKPRTGGIRWQSVQVAINGGSAEKKALVRRGAIMCLGCSRCGDWVINGRAGAKPISAGRAPRRAAQNSTRRPPPAAPTLPRRALSSARGLNHYYISSCFSPKYAPRGVSCRSLGAGLISMQGVMGKS